MAPRTQQTRAKSSPVTSTSLGGPLAPKGAQCKKEHIGDPSRIRCTLPLVGDHCRNGKGCLFNHGSEGAGSSTAHK
eukprot:scaffold15986_cov142-Isochrysis_galbana.AAC.4